MRLRKCSRTGIPRAQCRPCDLDHPASEGKKMWMNYDCEMRGKEMHRCEVNTFMKVGKFSHHPSSAPLASLYHVLILLIG